MSGSLTLHVLEAVGVEGSLDLHSVWPTACLTEFRGVPKVVSTLSPANMPSVPDSWLIMYETSLPSAVAVMLKPSLDANTWLQRASSARYRPTFSPHACRMSDARSFNILDAL